MNFKPAKTFFLAMLTTSCFLYSCDSSSTSNSETPAPSDTAATSVPGSVKAPVFSPAGGTYTTSQMIAVYSLHPTRTTIYYTTDGSTPTTSSTKFTIAITVSESKTLKAIAVDSTGKTSTVTSAAYVIPTLSTGTGTVVLAGQTYKTVKIGTQTWMAENLNYKGTGADTVGVCYNNSVDSCTKYGRLYKWSEAMAGKPSSRSFPSGVQGICPAGWHMPSDSEWTTLTAFVGEKTSATKLKSIAGWLLAGTDAYGFKVLSAGYQTTTPSFGYSGNKGLFWTTSEAIGGSGTVLYRDFTDGNQSVSTKQFSGSNRVSLRCVQD